MISQRQFAPKCLFLLSRPLRGYSFRISWQISKFYKFDFYDFITLGLFFLALGVWSLPSHCFSGFRRCQCECHCRDQFLFAPSIPVAARTIVLITNPLTACFFPITVFCHLIFAASVANLRPVLDIYCTKCQTLFSCTYNKLNNT